MKKFMLCLISLIAVSNQALFAVNERQVRVIPNAFQHPVIDPGSFRAQEAIHRVVNPGAYSLPRPMQFHPDSWVYKNAMLFDRGVRAFTMAVTYLITSEIFESLS